MTGTADVVIIGGGIVGLWCALRASSAGLHTILVERGEIAQGASGGLLGALMPHQPANWTDVKQFQYDALVSLEEEIAGLEAATGQCCGYLRCGRVLPVRSANKRAQVETMAAAAKEAWSDRFTWAFLARSDEGWLSPASAPVGVEVETLSARVAPRALTAALHKAIASDADVLTMRSATGLELEGTAPCVRFDDGSRIVAGHVVVAAGVQAFDLVAALLPTVEARHFGRGVKGQAALLMPRRPVDPTSPIIYDGGLYIIAHGERQVAVGSTSEDEFSDPGVTDGLLGDLIARAGAICPALAGADVVERWAGVRPKAVGRQPIVGPLPDAPRIVLAGGGFKISFGVAHAMADAAIGFVTGRDVRLPERMTVADHLSRARREAEKVALHAAS